MASVYLVSALNPGIPQPGGVRQHVLGLAKALHTLGREVFVVGAGPDADLPFADFVSVTPHYPLSQYRFFLSLCRWILARGPSPGSIIHAHRPDDLYPFTKLRHSGRYVCTLHGSPWASIAARRPLARFPYDHVEGQALAAASQVIAVSARARDDYSERYPSLRNKLTVVPIGFSRQACPVGNHNMARSRFGTDGQVVLLFSGRLEPEKHVETLIEVANRLGKSVVVLLAGSGRLEKQLRDTVSGTNVRFLGVLSPESMRGLYAAADALVLPSAFEGLPTAAIEALSCGTPVIATRVGDLPSIITEGETGLFFDGSADALANLVIQRSADLRGMRSNCPKVAEPYDWSVVAPRILEIYRAAESGEKPGADPRNQVPAR